MTLISGNFTVNGIPFAVWFNAMFQPFQKTVFPNTLKTSNFLQVMNNFEKLTGQKSVALEEFIGHFGIIYNETGGQFAVLREGGNLQYLFSTNGGKKRSYNQPSNLLAGNQLKSWGVITDAAAVNAWNAQEWPAAQYVTPQVLAKLPECDFNKFRGFGFNQLTWRGNYEKCLLPYLKKKKLDDYATTAEFDAELKDNFAAACGSYYQFIQAFPSVKAAAAKLASGVYYDYGKAVSGGDAYAKEKYVPRCNALLAALKTTVIAAAPATVPALSIAGLNLPKAVIQQLQTKIINSGNALAKAIIVNTGGADGDWGQNTEAAFRLLNISIQQLQAKV